MLRLRDHARRLALGKRKDPADRRSPDRQSADSWRYQGHLVFDWRPDQCIPNGRAAWMGDAHPGSHQERVFHHGNPVRRLESGGRGKGAVAEPVLLRCTVERIALHLHAGRPRLLDWSLGGQQTLMSRTPSVTLGVWGIRLGAVYHRIILLF